ncbi:MAG: GTPase (G3E family) [Eggerthellaceae bacterium]|nr:GTPase (G3E family) [Eggerthellaceae bacterium]
MSQTKFMVVSGFLGAGKTTTMIAMAECINGRNGNAAIIANDLGANLVDTNLTQTTGCKVVEIASGCICYQMDNLVDQVRRLRDKDGARFIMSDIPGCGVGALEHVYHPLARDCADEISLAPFMVVADPERLRMIMPEKADINLPEELVYLLKLQLEEADLVVLNKIDLLTEEDIARYVDFLKTACPDIPVICISARERTNIDELVDFVTTKLSAVKNFKVNYDEKFDQAEGKLTWYNRRLFFKTNSSAAIDYNAVIDDMIESIRMGLIERKRNVPHLKTFATAHEDGSDFSKASLIGVDYDTEYERTLEREHDKVRMIINARAVCESRPLARIVDDAVDEVCDRYDLDCQIFFTECFGMTDEGRR